MPSEFESGKNINPAEGAELTPEVKAYRKIEEHIKEAELESPRFQAFADFTDLQYAGLFHTQDDKMIQETIRQRRNGVKGYKKELEHTTGVALDYIKSLAGKNLPEPEELKEKQLFFEGLRRIKDQEIDRKNQES